MKKKELYYIFAVCLLMLSSCLGDTNTRITMGEQEAVYQARPVKGFYIKDNRFLYGSDVSANGDNGDCFLIEYSFDASSPELQNSDSLSIELIANPAPVSLWPLDRQLTDTTIVLPDEMLTREIQTRHAYIKGRLFLWSTHTILPNQQDSFMMSYNPEMPYTTEEGKRVYNLYLRAIARIDAGDEEELPRGEQLNILNAYNVEDFFTKAKRQEEERGSDSLHVAIRYASAFNKDTTACIWDSKQFGFQLKSIGE